MFVLLLLAFFWVVALCDAGSGVDGGRTDVSSFSLSLSLAFCTHSLFGEKYTPAANEFSFSGELGVWVERESEKECGVPLAGAFLQLFCHCRSLRSSRIPPRSFIH